MKSLIDSSTDLAEIKAFSTAQSKTIIELSKKNKEQADEIIHLKKLLEGSVPLVKTQTDITNLGSNDQEFICRVGLDQLKQISTERELTLEECKKLDIFSKILKELASTPKTIEVKAKTLTDDALLQIVDNK